MFFYWNDQSIFQMIPQDFSENCLFHICFFKSSSVAHKITLLKYLPTLLLIFLSTSLLTCFTEKINVHRKWDFVWTFFSVFERSEFDSILPKCFSRNRCSLNEFGFQWLEINLVWKLKASNFKNKCTISKRLQLEMQCANLQKCWDNE